jgi:hypothetical protein
VSSESVIVAQCLEWLALHRIFAWRNNTGAYRTPSGAFVRYGQVGSSDILGILPGGRFLAVECKTATGRQRKAQEVFEAMVIRNGGVYILARSTSDLERALVPLPQLAS